MAKPISTRFVLNLSSIKVYLIFINLNLAVSICLGFDDVIVDLYSDLAEVGSQYTYCTYVDRLTGKSCKRADPTRNDGFWTSCSNEFCWISIVLGQLGNYKQVPKQLELLNYVKGIAQIRVGYKLNPLSGFVQLDPILKDLDGWTTCEYNLTGIPGLNPNSETMFELSSNGNDVYDAAILDKVIFKFYALDPSTSELPSTSDFETTEIYSSTKSSESTEPIETTGASTQPFDTSEPTSTTWSTIIASSMQTQGPSSSGATDSTETSSFTKSESTQVSGSTGSPDSTQTDTQGSTQTGVSTEGSTELPGSTQIDESTKITGQTQTQGSTESKGSTQQTPGSTGISGSTDQTPGSTETSEFTEGSTKISGTTEQTPGSTETTEFTVGSTEISGSTDQTPGSTETSEFTVGSTETSEFTEGSTKISGTTEQTSGSTETTEFTVGSTEISGSTDQTPGSTETSEFTEGSTKISGTTEQTSGSTETTEFTVGSTEISCSTDQTPGSTETTKFTVGSTEISCSTDQTPGSTETSEFTEGSTKISGSTDQTPGSTETSEFTEGSTKISGSTEQTPTSTGTQETSGIPESTTDIPGSTEPQQSTPIPGSTQTSALTETSGSTQSQESTETSQYTESQTQQSTDISGTTETEVVSTTEIMDSTESHLPITSTEIIESTKTRTDGSHETTTEGSTETPSKITPEFTETSKPTETLTTLASSSAKFESTETPITSTEKLCPGIFCNAVDRHNTAYTACSEKTAIEKCPNYATGFASWFCQSIGEFEGNTPDFTRCKSDWFSLYQEEVDKGQPIPPDVAEKYLDEVVDKIKAGFYFGHEIGDILVLASDILTLVETSVNINQFENLTDNGWNIFGEILRNTDPWEEIDIESRAEAGTLFLSTLDKTGLGLAARVTKNSTFQNGDSMPVYRKDFQKFPQFRVLSGVQRKSRNLLSFPDEYSPNDSHIDLPSNWADYLKSENVTNVGFEMKSDRSNSIFPGFLNNIGSDGKLINSKILGFTFGNQLDKIFIKKIGNETHRVNFTGVKITFQHDLLAWGNNVANLRRRLHDGEMRKAVSGSSACVYWDPENRIWSVDGCETIISERSNTICECKHLTSFALLMDVHNYIGKDLGLEILTLILCPISIVCLAICIYIFSTVKSERSPRTTLTRNLCICLLIGNMLMIFVMDKHYFYLSDEMCVAFAVSIHYIFLCAMLWMALEGTLIFRVLFLDIFGQGKNYILLQHILAYGIPAVIVGTTGLITGLNGDQGYGNDSFCWLNGNYIWAFLGPTALILTMNLVILTLSVRKAFKIRNQPQPLLNAKIEEKSLTWLKGCFSLSIILGLTWIFGYLMIIDHSDVANIAAYIFTILNSSQGIFLFVFHIIMNNNVRSAMKRRLPSWIYSKSIKHRTQVTEASTINTHTT